MKKFGISFDELDTSEHDKQVYNKAIEDFNCYVIHEESIGNIKSLDDYDRIAEHLKGGASDEI